MFKYFISLFLLAAAVAQAQVKPTKKSISKALSSVAKSSVVTEGDAANAIKDALSKGVSSAILNLNKTDGFFQSNLYKVLLPPDAQKIETTLRKIGMGAEVDKAILQINRGAEKAVGTAAPIFTDAIKQMTLTDALNIVKGQQDAATQYFKGKTTDQLTQAFSPSIKASLDSVGATKYYGNIVKLYNDLPTTFKKINPDLPSYVTGKTMEALFSQIAAEEANIRNNPSARTTDILKKVFGGK